MHYEVLYGQTFQELQSKIDNYLSMGWIKEGGMTICSREQYYQTMISK